jgi:hypothetical protein
VGLVAMFYCLRFETSLFVASYDSQGYGGVGRIFRVCYKPSTQTTHRKHSFESIYASDGELGHVNHESSSSKSRARHSLLENLIWLRFLIWHHGKGNCMNIFVIKRVHFELKKKYKGNKLEKFCYVDSDALMENL